MNTKSAALPCITNSTGKVWCPTKVYTRSGFVRMTADDLRALLAALPAESLEAVLPVPWRGAKYAVDRIQSIVEPKLSKRLPPIEVAETVQRFVTDARTWQRERDDARAELNQTIQRANDIHAESERLRATRDEQWKRAEAAERERDEARAEVEKLRVECWFVTQDVAGSTPAGASTGGGVEAADGERGAGPVRQVRREEHPTSNRSFYDAVKAFETEHPDDGWPVSDLDLVCDAFDIAMRAIEHGFGAPIPIRLHCPECGELHVDAGEFATRPHHTHACQHCGAAWRPAVVPTVGVRYLPGFKDDPPEPVAASLADDQQPHELTLDAVQDAALKALRAVDGPARAALQAFASEIGQCVRDAASGPPDLERALDHLARALDRARFDIASDSREALEQLASAIDGDGQTYTAGAKRV